MKTNQKLNRGSGLSVFPHINIPRKTLTVKQHALDQHNVLAAYLAHPYLDAPKKDVTFKPHEIDAIYSFLQDNKVILSTLNQSLSSKQSTPKKERLIRELVEKHKSFANTHEFAFRLKRVVLKIMTALTENGVEIIFIKSLAEIPLDSSNFDVLVKKQYIVKARRTLEDLGFTELKKIREYKWGGVPHKFLYRKLQNGIMLSIHLHTEVAWEGIKFIDEKELWNCIRNKKIGQIRLGFPSPENHLLITVAHAFFEDKCFKLSHLMFMVEDIKCGRKLDWNYIINRTTGGGWFGPFYAILKLADYIHVSLFREKLVDETVFKKLSVEGYLQRASSLEEQLVNSFKNERTLPLKIPRRRIIMAFIKKVFATPRFSFIERISKILATSWLYAKRRLKSEIPGFLVCFSGQDGTGKTKHSRLLRKELIKRNIKSDYVWSRGIDFSIEPLLRLLRLLLLGSKFSQSSEYVSQRRILLENEPARTLWTYATLTDEILLLLFKVRIPLLLNRVVICDRYIHDIVLDVKCELGKDINPVIEEFAKKLVPKPNIHFVLDAKLEEIIERKKDSNPALVICKRDHYLQYFHMEEFALINTSRSLERNTETILSLFMKARYIGKD